MREKEVGDEDWLGAAQVRVRWHHRDTGLLCLLGQHANQRCQRALNGRHAAAQVEPKIDGYLLVARSTGMKTAAGVADTLHELALDECVNVLVVVRGRGRKER